MKTAFACWDNRIAPVFDTVQDVHIVEIDAAEIVHESLERVPAEVPVQKVLQLVGLGVSTLVCGAISRPVRELITAYGIQVIPFITGDLREVIQAWLKGTLHRDIFSMPGCYHGRARRNQSQIRIIQEGNVMNSKRQGNGRGRKSRQEQATGGIGRMGGPLADGPEGICACPRCGYQKPHERGIPCVEQQCPKCGNFMVRQ